MVHRLAESMQIYCFDQENERVGCTNLAAYAEQALKLSHASLLKVLDVHVSKSGTWRLITAGLPERIALIGHIAEQIETLSDACSIPLSLAEAYAYLYRMNFRGGKTFSWEIECIAASRGSKGELRLALVPPSPFDIESLQRSGFYGNPRYAAAELIASDKAKPNEATDSFTLGAILYHLLARQPLITASGSIEAVQLAFAANFTPLEQLNPSLSAELATFIGRAISREPTARPSLREWSFVMEKFGGRVLEQPEESQLGQIPAGIEPAPGYRRVLATAEGAQIGRLGAGSSKTLGGAASGFGGTLELPDHSASPPAAKPDVIVDENVQFTVFRPKAVQPLKWYDVFAYAHLEELPDDADPSEPEPKEVMQRDVKKMLGAKIKEYKETTEDSSQAVPHEGEITFVPEIEGFEFNPPRFTFRWCERVHRADFRMRASSAPDGKLAVGQMSVFLGAILLADITLKIKVDSQYVSPSDEPDEQEKARPYRKIFASYSHRDLAIVEQFEHYAHAMGDRYIRDWKDLRAGENWDTRLLEMIEEADVFQLFWSQNSMRSEYVRQEWEHALSLTHKGSGFVRPTYWESPFPQSPAEELPPPHLSRLHFTQLATALANRPPPVASPFGAPDAISRPSGASEGLPSYSVPGAVVTQPDEDLFDYHASKKPPTTPVAVDDSDFELTLNDPSAGSLGAALAEDSAPFSLELEDAADPDLASKLKPDDEFMLAPPMEDDGEFELTLDADSGDHSIAPDSTWDDSESGSAPVGMDDDFSMPLDDSSDEEPDSVIEDSSDFELDDESPGAEASDDPDGGEEIVPHVEEEDAGEFMDADDCAASSVQMVDDEEDDFEAAARSVVKTHPRARAAFDDEDEEYFAPAKARGGLPWWMWTIGSAALTLGAVVAAHLLGLF